VKLAAWEPKFDGLIRGAVLLSSGLNSETLVSWFTATIVKYYKMFYNVMFI